MRRLLAPGFSPQGVLHFETEIIEMVEHYVQNIEQASQPVDLHHLTNVLFQDIISQLAFAKTFDILSGKPHQGAEDISTYFNVAPMFGMVPIARYLPFGPFRAVKEAQPQFVQLVQACLDEFRERIQKGTAENGLLRHMIEAKDDETAASFSDSELIENCVIFILTGSETSATTVLYLLYEMSRKPAMQKRLENEIRQAFPDQKNLPKFDAANQLPFLNCVLQETLRLSGPLPTNAPRISPGKTIGGVYIPAGTVVSNPAYSAQRDPSVFSHPDKFFPERWTNATPAMKVMNRPFSIGPRNCIGQYLARVQMILAVCALYQRFDLRLDPSITAEMMVMRDLGIMSMMGKKLTMYATPIDL